MAIKSALKAFVARSVKLATNQAEQVRRNGRNVDIFLSAALKEAGTLSTIQYPGAYIDLLRSLVEPMVCVVKEVRREHTEGDPAAGRFATLLDVLTSELPPIPLETAREIAQVADRYHGLSAPVDTSHWNGDLGLLFAISSSFGRKGRILTAVVRFSRSRRCLEAGTAFGMSSLFILAALKALGDGRHLATLEAMEPQFSLASETLLTRYEGMVSCFRGLTEEKLPDLAQSQKTLDFFFHDAGHSYKAYVSDFAAVVDTLAPGGVVLIDDIRWEDARFSQGPADTYRGWREVVGHARVKWAAEIDGNLGLLLLN